MCEPFTLRGARYEPKTSGWLSTKNVKNFYEPVLPENHKTKENCWWLDNPTFEETVVDNKNERAKPFKLEFELDQGHTFDAMLHRKNNNRFKENIDNFKGFEQKPAL